ncbi:MAG: hypothetical protein JNL58_04540 [Planctomyces sp.]|nr:hypothetical protein [Planctomyces sp.]
MSDRMYMVEKPGGKRTKAVTKAAIIEAFKAGKLSDECRVYPSGSESFLMIEEFVFAENASALTSSPPEMLPVVIQALPKPVPIERISGSPRRKRRSSVRALGFLATFVLFVASVGGGWLWVVAQQRMAEAEKQRIAEVKRLQEAEDQKKVEALIVAALYQQNLATIVDREAKNEDRSSALGTVVKHCANEAGLDMEFGAHAPKLTEVGMPTSSDFASGVVFIVLVEDEKTILNVRFNDLTYFNEENMSQFDTIRKIGCLIAYQLCEARFQVAPDAFTSELTSLKRDAVRSLTKDGPGWSGTMETSISNFAISYSRK